MTPEQIKNLKNFISMILISVILSIWFTVLCQALNPSLITVLFILGTMITIIKEYTKIIINDMTEFYI